MMIGVDALTRLDSELARHARLAGACTLRLAQLLEQLGQAGGHHVLGYSSMGAYVQQCCERSKRWVVQLRSVARRLKQLPLVRQALENGQIHFSQAEVLAQHATTESEVELLRLALSSTVRQLREHCALQEGRKHSAAQAGAENARNRAAASHCLVVTLPREEAWLLESTRLLADAVGVRTQEQLVSALLAEGWTSFLAEPGLASSRRNKSSGADCLDTIQMDTLERARQLLYTQQREQWRRQAEAMCEPRLQLHAQPGSFSAHDGHDAHEFDLGASAVEFDLGASGATSRGVEHARRLTTEIRRVCGALTERDWLLGSLALQFFAADGWRRLGYATKRQYARERLGISYSSLKERIALVRRALKLPEIAEALRKGVVGFEAARLVARIASPKTVKAWLVRAKERTLKNFREDVEVAELLQRLSLASKKPFTAGVEPPDEAAVYELMQLRGRVTAGVMANGQGRQLPAEAAELHGGARRKEPGHLPAASAPQHTSPSEHASLPEQACLPQHTPLPEQACLPQHTPLPERASVSRGATAVGARVLAAQQGLVAALQSWAARFGGRHASAEASSERVLQPRTPRGQMSAPLEPAAAWGSVTEGQPDPNALHADRFQLARALHRRARCRFRYRVEEDTLVFFRWFEREFAKHFGSRVSFVSYLCRCFWQSWGHTKDTQMAYAHIYQRDGHQCRSPVCTRRDVTPHHLIFRAKGGTDAPENLLSLCVWCHLFGVHGGRLNVAPPASKPHWIVGTASLGEARTGLPVQAGLRVHGRRLLAA